MKRNQAFTRGVIIVTLLLLTVVVSFFAGKILGNELMAGGREKLEPFTAKAFGGDKESEDVPLLNSEQTESGYSGPTSDRFEQSWASIPDEEAPAENSPVTIEPLDSTGETEGEVKSESSTTSLFGLDGGDDEVDEKVVFRVQVGVFTVLANAEKLAKALREERYSAYTQQVEFPDGEIRWKVFVGPFDSLEAANAVAETLRGRSYEAFVK